MVPRPRGRGRVTGKVRRQEEGVLEDPQAVISVTGGGPASETQARLSAGQSRLWARVQNHRTEG